ncbi:MAG: dTDP-glucose 4,6-dehydratase [Methanothrix sp.]|uniref:dTDP-glucose 4,6-dehydratase n=2 Tax=Methanothrix sp. TaxID=90426 RepID=UPI001BD27BE3|nr:dTDP-glucose 4,6-dehydratase [Methanothrix sp.]
MNLLVTGGLGFIGSNFIRLILSRDEDCRILNLDALHFGSNMQNLADFADDCRYTFCQGDITDGALLARLVEKADMVVNFAAETHVDRSISHPDSFLQSNVIGVYTLLEAIRAHNPSARYVQISTDEVYGDILTGSFTEESTLRPSSPYSASKAAGDVFVLAYARTYGLEAVITRCTNNYGPYQFPEKLIPKTIIRAREGLKIPIYGTGENVRDWIYVRDHCLAIEEVLRRGRKGQIYNISAGEERTNLFIARFILELLGRGEDQIEFVEDRPGHDARYSLDSSLVREELGWRPEQSFEEGLRMTVEWYLNNPDWYRPLIDDSILSATPWRVQW